MATKPDCDACRRLAKEYGKEPNCYECLPDLEPENQQPYEVYVLVHDQHIMGSVGPVSLSLNAVYKTMELLDVKDQLTTLTRIKAAYNATMDAVKAKAEEKHGR